MINAEENISSYLDICADSYNNNSENQNHLSSGWQRLNIYGSNSDEETNINDYYYQSDTNGFDAAIYYNIYTKELVIGIRGTEPFAFDGDVSDSIKILSKNENIDESTELVAFKMKVDEVLSKYNLDVSSYTVTGQSLGGSLALEFATLFPEYYAVAINPLGNGYKINNSEASNFIVMNDFLAAMNYQYQTGTIKLVFPVEMNDSFLSFLDPHNSVIFNNEKAEYFEKNIIELDAYKTMTEFFNI